ncbi:bacterial sugar transferase domain protein [Leptospira interrogans str. 2002000626]|uniref:Bacterial sugar transferase domain protein n=1 Tax=Leptospira interrogans str. 2002000626 TaxID=996803 RepID=A0A829D330_LEPIR|nr:bacterial sugar transferase domain protein [Leptospira interrogans str. 2002000626]
MQIFNVLKGDMSFIGPRPESMELSEWYEKDVPFLLIDMLLDLVYPAGRK